jgi:hypothetical protein
MFSASILSSSLTEEFTEVLDFLPARQGAADTDVQPALSCHCWDQW